MPSATPRLLAALLLAAGPALALPPEVSERLALYESWVEQQRAYRHQPAVAVGIVQGPELVWAKGFGLADVAAGRPATPDTIFRIGSITKTFTATALLQLRDAGALRLDDPVSDHLPSFRFRNRFPDAPAITVRDLLTHTSGLPREAAFPYWTDRVFPSRDELREALAGQENLFEPGAGYRYSNLGLALAGEVVAAAAGRPYARYVRERILEPLGMASTFVETGDIDPERLATGYLVTRPDGTQPVAPGTDARGLTPAANISSTVRDLARYVAAHLGGGPEGGSPLLAAHTRREMQRVHWLAPSWTSGRGLGFAVWREESRTLVGHGGWVAGHRSQIAFDPQAGIGVIVLTNSDEGGPGVYVEQAFALVVPALEAAAREEPPARTVENPARYAGAYHNPWGEVTEMLVMDGGLVVYDHSYPPTSSPGAALAELVPDGEHAFRFASRDGTGERVVFELTPDGRVARVKRGENYLFPADCGRIGPDLQCTWE